MESICKKLTIAALAVVIILVLATGFLYIMKDNDEPEIIFSSDTVRYDGVNSQLLLADVTAKDDVDGDVSDSLRVKAVMETDDEIIVTYLAKDHSNNITESIRHIRKSE